MALDWDWMRQPDGTEVRVQTRGDTDGQMGFAILEAESGDEDVWGLNAETVERLRDCLDEWLARQGRT